MIIQIEIPAALESKAKNYGIDLNGLSIKNRMLSSVYEIVNQGRLQHECDEYCAEIDADPTLSESEKEKRKYEERESTMVAMMGR